MFTPEIVAERNLKKLKFIVSTAIPLKIQFKNKFESALFNLEFAFRSATTNTDKLNIAEQMKEIYIHINDQENMKKCEQIINELKNTP